MMNIRKFTENDIEKYRCIYECVYELYNDYIGMYYILNIDGIEKVLHRIDNIFTIFSLDNTRINYSVFTVNEDYKVVDAGFDEFETHLVENKMVVQKRENLFTECLSFEKRENGVDTEGYDGVIVYTQYNLELDIRAIITYQQMFNEDCHRIYQSHIEIPFTYTIEKNVIRKRAGSHQTFIKGEYRIDLEPFTFNIATIKDYGLISLLKEGAINLQKTDKITRYYKVLAYLPQKYAITGFPFTRQYNSSDMEDLFKSYNFNTCIPMYLLNLYNGEYPEMNLFNNIASMIRDFELSYKQDDTVVKDNVKMLLK